MTDLIKIAERRMNKLQDRRREVLNPVCDVNDWVDLNISAFEEARAKRRGYSQDRHGGR